jgi:diguanylate cyclase (GGDEF)-like protein/PAS domain S-box-containing protein
MPGSVALRDPRLDDASLGGRGVRARQDRPAGTSTSTVGLPRRSPEVGPRASGLPAALLGELAGVGVWELWPGEPEARWPVPIEQLLGQGLVAAGAWLDQRGAPADGVQPVGPGELPNALLAPLVRAIRAGLAGDRAELIREVVTVDRLTRRILLRGQRVPDGGEGHWVGVATELADPPAPGAAFGEPEIAERLQLLVEHSPDGVAVHQDGLVVYCNATAARMVGYEDPAACLGRPVLSFVRADCVRGVISRIRRLRVPGDVVKGHRISLVRPDGSELEVELASAMTSWGGRPAIQVILHDVSERTAAQEAEAARRATERRYAAAVAALEEAVVVFDAQGGVQAANRAARRILGSRLQQGVADGVLTGVGRAVDPEGQALAPTELPVARVLSGRVPVASATVGVQGDDGREQWLRVTVRRLDEPGADGVAVCSVAEITEHKQLVDQLAWEARHDGLTGVLNRAGLVAHLEGVLADPLVAEASCVVVLDLDRFKLVNDSLGHAVGDEVLRAVAGRLAEAVPAGSTLARIHGDGFAVVIGGVHSGDEALAWGDYLRAVVGEPLRLAAGRTLGLQASVGVCRASGGSDPDRLLRDADLAMLEAKNRRRGRAALFDAGLREEIGGRMELEHDLRAAVAQGQLRVEYQPVGALADGRVVGLEALVRWDHPNHGRLLPARFIGLAEESELISTLGAWVLVQSCSQMARWRARHPQAAEAFVAVNVSPRQLEGPDLLPAVEEALRRSGLAPSALVLEITESGFVAEDPHVAKVLEDLRDLGVRLAIDDFGAGYSSLGQLKRLPVDFLKIDRVFVEELGANPRDDLVVSVVAELGHGLGCQVIAEGIEEERQRAAAWRLGCDLYQGYLLARPLTVRQAGALWGPARG